MVRVLFDWVVPFVVVLSVCAFMIALSGCSTTGDTPRSIDLAVKGSYTPGSGASTRNQTPQGGTDEKSDSTPAEPTSRF